MNQFPLRMNKSIGITGGIGSGKSVVAMLLQLYGIPVYIADEESKKLLNTSPMIRAKLTGLFGESLYTADGLDKKQLASFIFSNKDYLRKVNDIVHPEVYRHFEHWLSVQEAPLGYCGMESAILFESGFNRLVDTTLMVYAPLELRLSRVGRRDQVDREEILKRIESQWPDEVKKQQSDYVIHNDDIQPLIPQVETFLTSLKKK